MCVNKLILKRTNQIKHNTLIVFFSHLYAMNFDLTRFKKYKMKLI